MDQATEITQRICPQLASFHRNLPEVGEKIILYTKIAKVIFILIIITALLTL
jgi:hypothetical protein